MKHQKIWSGITAILVTTLFGTTSTTTLSSQALASNTNNEEIAKVRTSPLEDDQSNKIATIYTYQIGKSAAATLYVRSIPILTFLEKPDISTNNPLDPSFQAQQVADKINQLTESELENSDITVSWSAKSKSFLLKINGEILTHINDRIKLADSTDKLPEDALNATNRLRRLLSDAPPLEEITGFNWRNNDNNLTPIPKPTPSTPQFNILKTFQGLASWYGPGFHGRRTASGQRFNQNGLTAAHRSLPFGTKVRVTNLRNGRSTIVSINDRGPYSGRRIIDLSAGAAKAIGLYHSGVGNVKLEILAR